MLKPHRAEGRAWMDDRYIADVSIVKGSMAADAATLAAEGLPAIEADVYKSVARSFATTTSRPRGKSRNLRRDDRS